MTEGSPRPALFWQKHIAGDGTWHSAGPLGADLAALRRGLGRQAGDVAEMWRFYTQLRADGSTSTYLHAEHVALSLYALHQQGISHCMHRNGVGFGTAMRRAKDSGVYSSDAIDRRFSAAATANGFTELTGHLRGLITQLRTIESGGRRGQPLDYTRIYFDLNDWQYPEKRVAVRRRWGSQYFGHVTEEPGVEEPPIAAPNL